MSLLIRADGFPLGTVLREMENLLTLDVPSVKWALGDGGYPPVNMYETPDAAVLEFQLPGVAPSDAELTVSSGSLTLKVKRPVEGDIAPEKYYIRERWRGEFGRTVAIPGTVDTAAAKAVYANGILTVTIPKKAETRPRRIDVKVG